MKCALVEKGYALWHPSVGEDLRTDLRATIFHPGEAGRRCLLDLAIVISVAQTLGRELIDVGLLDANAVAIQAIAFDKSSDTNWKSRGIRI